MVTQARLEQLRRGFQVLQTRTGGQDGDVSKRAKRKQVIIATDDAIRPGFNRAGQYLIIIRIAFYRLDQRCSGREQHLCP